MATAKKLEFQAERKAAAWQSGKPQPAPLPADVHAATCLIDSDGEAARTAYPVFPGIEIAYHDVHAASAATQRACAAGCLEIHHCREGRIAYPYGDACFFLAPGDLAIVQRAAEAVPVRFPTGHYHGITVTIDPARAPDCLSCFLEDVEVRPSALIEKFCADGACFVTRSSPGVAHIFSELYSVPEGIRKGYFKVKILELLLFLSAFPIQAAQPQHGYSLSQVQLAEQIGAYLLQNTERRATRCLQARRTTSRSRRLHRNSVRPPRSSPRAFAACTACRRRRFCVRRKCMALPDFCAGLTARCWILPGNSGMITAASSPKHSGMSSVSHPTPIAAASTATAARRRHPWSDGGKHTFILEPCSDELERMPAGDVLYPNVRQNKARNFSHVG